MTLFQEAPGDPRTAAAQVADVLALYGAIGDAACGNPPGFAFKKATVAVALARIARLDAATCDAVYFAGILHAVGAIGNAAYRTGARLTARFARMEAWDVPVFGARACAQIAALPSATADIVRWQSECWDGTGYPDQLRWNGIPPSAMVLALADAFVRAGDPEEALVLVGAQSGRAYDPDLAGSFMQWYHVHRDDDTLAQPPLESLRSPTTSEAAHLLDTVADRVDAHNASEGRWRRIERLTAGAATALQLDERTSRQLAQAVRLYGAGEIGDPDAENFFDPLARLGIDQRAKHATAAAQLTEEKPALRDAAELLRARAEWYDGTGKPEGLLQHAIPPGARVLAAAIAYDSLDRKERIHDAIGTQFEPTAVRAVAEAARASVV
jgi:response regulator RpfG family c-di-GMP phosphodiesterase